MEFVRIYLPNDLFRTPDECLLYGRIQFTETSTLIYVTTAMEPVSQEVSLIGAIQPGLNLTKQSNFLHFVPAAPAIKDSHIKLRSVTLADVPVSPSTRFQIINYDQGHLLTIPYIDISTDRRPFDEEIGALLGILHDSHVCSINSPGWSRRLIMDDVTPNVQSQPLPNNSCLPRLGLPFSAIQHTAVFQHLVARRIMLKRLDRYDSLTA